MNLLQLLEGKEMDRSSTVNGLTIKDQRAIKGCRSSTIATTALGIALAYSAFPVAMPNAQFSSSLVTTAATMTSNSVIEYSSPSVWSDRVLPNISETNVNVSPDFSARISFLKEQTGLTWDQIARLFGVSRRAVFHWAVGGKMNSFNIETLGYLETNLLDSQNAITPEARKLQIFSLTENGKSKFDNVMSRVSVPGFAISGNAQSASEQVASLQV